MNNDFSMVLLINTLRAIARRAEEAPGIELLHPEICRFQDALLEEFAEPLEQSAAQMPARSI